MCIRDSIKKVVEELDRYISYAAKSSFHAIEPVSYTPLDVYKRQAQTYPAGSPEYNKIFMTAVLLNPEHPVANLLSLIHIFQSVMLGKRLA